MSPKTRAESEPDGRPEFDEKRTLGEASGGPMDRHIFHLSIPVSELGVAKTFYVEALGAEVGRENADWLDILLWGHQITLQRRPEEVLSLAQQGKRHFGATLPWADWERHVERLRSKGVPFLEEPSIKLEG